MRASFLRFLALGGDEHAPLHEKGLSLHGAGIEGKLDIEGAILPHSLELSNCHLSSIAILRHSNIHGFLRFRGCCFESLDGDHMVCSGSVFLTGGFTSTGTVRLVNAQIGGDLLCGKGKFDGKDGEALTCDGAVIKGDVYLNDGFTVMGSVSLLGARIDGYLVCNEGKFDGKDHDALICLGAVIKGSVLLSDGFTAAGTVNLADAQIGEPFT